MVAVDRKEAHRLSLKVRRVLMEHSSNDKMSVLQFQSVYHTMFGESITTETIQEKLSETVNVMNLNNSVNVVRVYIFIKFVFRLSKLNLVRSISN